jgi:hypothetical protein
MNPELYLPYRIKDQKSCVVDSDNIFFLLFYSSNLVISLLAVVAAITVHAPAFTTWAGNLAGSNTWYQSSKVAGGEVLGGEETKERLKGALFTAIEEKEVGNTINSHDGINQREGRYEGAVLS